ncbi:type II secretion system protein [Alishewanella tabrizica]|uniref:MSHA pilin protein MshC n=1 Tax=Alishewanella tabrizica TaxID=671278 RepID=A0ABQ2WE23_9ALTE|nr:prepilin-type N-terminal cleavage/methylation domain-containing protein [Alishewanella tabrizica]GGW48604.1 hypothetical protein GCM10008111_00320 [Alishewanella tabrizica]
MKIKPRGFTLVELIVVIILIGVLAISLVPRFFTSSGSSEVFARAQALALLQRVQQQAMQCTSSDPAICPNVVLSLAADRLGTSSACLNDASHLCLSGTDVSLQTQPAALTTLTFDSWGRAPQCAASGCVLILQGQQSLPLCLESEGYIHPC